MGEERLLRGGLCKTMLRDGIESRQIRGWLGLVGRMRQYAGRGWWSGRWSFEERGAGAGAGESLKYLRLPRNRLRSPDRTADGRADGTEKKRKGMMCGSGGGCGSCGCVRLDENRANGNGECSKLPLRRVKVSQYLERPGCAVALHVQCPPFPAARCRGSAPSLYDRGPSLQRRNHQASATCTHLSDSA